MAWTLNQVFGNRESVLMGPVVDRVLTGFQYTLAVNWVQMLAKVLVVIYPSVRSKVVHADVLQSCDAWWDNWQDFLGRAGSKIRNIVGPFCQAVKSIAFPLRTIFVA